MCYEFHRWDAVVAWSTCPECHAAPRVPCKHVERFDAFCVEAPLEVRAFVHLEVEAAAASPGETSQFLRPEEFGTLRRARHIVDTATITTNTGSRSV